MTCVLIEQENQAMSTTLHNKEQKGQFQCKTSLSSQLIFDFNAYIQKLFYLQYITVINNFYNVNHLALLFYNDIFFNELEQHFFF